MTPHEYADELVGEQAEFPKYHKPAFGYAFMNAKTSAMAVFGDPLHNPDSRGAGEIPAAAPLHW